MSHSHLIELPARLLYKTSRPHVLAAAFLASALSTHKIRAQHSGSFLRFDRMLVWVSASSYVMSHPKYLKISTLSSSSPYAVDEPLMAS
jgi:hypothetical protein